MPRRPVLQGVVFEDRNGNRRMDDGEPARPGVSVLFGPLRTTTDERGRFRFIDRVDGALRVDPAALPAGIVVPPDLHLARTGTVAIPLIRTGSLELNLYLDRDHDAIRDPGESPARGALVSLRDARGRARDAVVDSEGRVRFGGLEPGPYLVLVFLVGNGRTSPRPLREAVEVRPGENLVSEIALPPHQRRIRIRGGSELPGFGGGNG
jgi:hypothetical protein